KRGEDPAAVLAKLFDLTELRTNFNVNTVALVDGAPRTLGLRECLLAYIAHQRAVLTRRTRHRREKAAARAHILEGLLKALDHLDEVIALIRAAESAEAAKHELISRFELTETQAQAVLDMQLRRLAALERSRLREEYDELVRLMAELDAILADPARLDGLLAQELSALKRAHATPRRSRLVAPGISAGDVLADGSRAGFDAQPVTVFVTAGSYLKPIPQRRTSPAHQQAHDPAVAVVRCTTHDSLLLVDEQGTGYRVDLADVPVVRARDRGTTVSQVLGGEAPAARLVGAVVLTDAPDVTLVTVSAQGQVKRTTVSEYDSRTWSGQAAGLKEGDRIAAVATCRDDDELLVAHSGGLVIRFSAEDVRPMGRTATGVIAMDIPAGETVVSLTVASDPGDSTGYVVTVAADGSAKRTPLGEYPVRGRGGKGVQTGVRRLLWCGIEADIHVQGEPPVIVRPVELSETRRTGKGQPLDVTVPGPVVPEVGSPPG
ncbi:MAG: hypothetical protein M3O70_16130, partial [Actinomycetota bacterium]|nr:hypothetical protein [Actinomycetota bacterium]